MNFTISELVNFTHEQQELSDKLWAIACRYDRWFDRYEYHSFNQKLGRDYQPLLYFTVFNSDMDGVTIPFHVLALPVEEAVRVMREEEDEARRAHEAKVRQAQQRLAEEKRLEEVRLHELSELERLKAKYEK